jgi:hypothetical protein
LALAATAALGIGSAGSAQAEVNAVAPSKTFTWGDCQVTLGFVKNPYPGGAVGGADIICAHYRGYIWAEVNLNEYTNYGWINVSTSLPDIHWNVYQLSVQTKPPYCDNKTLAYWDAVVKVEVDGYQRTFDLYSGLGYAPPWTPLC